MEIGEVELIMREAGIGMMEAGVGEVEAEDVGTVEAEMGVVEAEEIGMMEGEVVEVEAEEIGMTEAEEIGMMEAEEIGMMEAEMGVVERQKLECPGMEAVGTGSKVGNGRTSFTSLFALKVRDSLFLTNSSFSNVTKYNFNVPHVIRMVSIKYFMRQNEIKKDIFGILPR